MRAYVEGVLCSLLATRFKHFPNMSSLVAGEVSRRSAGHLCRGCKHPFCTCYRDRSVGCKP